MLANFNLYQFAAGFLFGTCIIMIITMRKVIRRPSRYWLHPIEYFRDRRGAKRYLKSIGVSVKSKK